MLTFPPNHNNKLIDITTRVVLTGNDSSLRNRYVLSEDVTRYQIQKEGLELIAEHRQEIQPSRDHSRKCHVEAQSLTIIKNFPRLRGSKENDYNTRNLSNNRPVKTLRPSRLDPPDPR